MNLPILANTQDSEFLLRTTLLWTVAPSSCAPIVPGTWPVAQTPPEEVDVCSSIVHPVRFQRVLQTQDDHLDNKYSDSTMSNLHKTCRCSWGAVQLSLGPNPCRVGWGFRGHDVRFWNNQHDPDLMPDLMGFRGEGGGGGQSFWGVFFVLRLTCVP